MRNFIVSNPASILNYEKNDIVYLRALGGISQAKITHIQSEITFDYITAGLSANIIIDLLLPNGDTIHIDTKEMLRTCPVKNVHIFPSYEDCRRNTNEIGKFIRDNITAGGEFLTHIQRNYKVEYSRGDFRFYAPTKNGVDSFSARSIIYNHDNSPLVFNIYSKYIGTTDELRECYNIHTTREGALNAYKPKLISFEEAKPKQETTRVRIVRVYETEIPTKELDKFLENAHEYEFAEGDECHTDAEVLK